MKSTLLEAITQAKEKYKTDKLSPILYRMYENDELVYIGIGGCRGNRIGYLRLQEHYKATMPSSLKWKILKIRLSQPTSSNNPLADAERYWDSLVWEFENGSTEYISNREKELITFYNPKYNIEFNQK